MNRAGFVRPRKGAFLIGFLVSAGTEAGTFPILQAQITVSAFPEP